MQTTVKLGPLTRVEGHLEIEVTVDTASGAPKVADARSAGTMFRGFEAILAGRDPRDAIHYTQRICGVCPISHGMASTLALEAAFGVRPTDNGRILRNLILGANFIQSHVLHFYHLALPDYINTTGLLDMSPWTPRYTNADMLAGTSASQFLSHYVQALEMRRKSHEMGAVFGGRMPSTASFAVGGCTDAVSAAKVTSFRNLLTELRNFISGVYVPDVQALGNAFPQYYSIGKGCGNLLAYGVFDLDAAGSSKLLKRGRYTDSANTTADPSLIKEYVASSWYTPQSGDLAPLAGVTTPDANKAGAYSWIKAPRYDGKVHEVGPLARMWVNGDYRRGISVMDRLMARALETQKVANAMDGWLGQLLVGGSSITSSSSYRQAATGVGLTEAPRGALGHWVQTTSGRVSRYQIVTPTAWNASPRDDFGQAGAIEQALQGAVVEDLAQPIEVMRIVHSFDPCLSCAVHVVRPGQEKAARQIVALPV
jgi:hydrogenase large subunit